MSACLNLRVKVSRAVFLLLAAMLSACSKPQENPDDAANEFLRAVHRKDCEKIFASFSTASQEKIRADSAKAIKDYPAYAGQFTPEKYYCTSVFANRFLTYNRGSAKLQKIEGSNAVVTVTYTEGRNELIPGFFPTKFVRVPTTLQLVKERGSWKIDLVTPSPAEREMIAAREKAISKEREAMAAAQQRVREMVHNRCTNFHLLARWTFHDEPVDKRIKDETGNFVAELLGAHIVDLPEGKGLQFQADMEAVGLPEAVLNYHPCGVIMFWFRRDDSQTLNRVLLKVWPGAFSETGIEVHPDGRIHYNVQRNSISSNERLEPQRFYQLAFVWNENGMRIYIDGRLDANLAKAAHIAANSTKTELGRDPNNPEKTGSRMTIRDLRVYEGSAEDATLAQLFSAK